MRYATAMLVCLFTTAALGAPRPLPFTYECSSPAHPSWKDNTGRQLANGKTGSSYRDPKNRRKWIHDMVIYTGGKAVVECSLKKPARVERVVAHVRRPNMNYKLRTLTVLANVAGAWVEKGRVAGFWGKSKKTFQLEIKGIDTVTSQLRLVFDAPSYLAVTEVQIYGRPVKTTGAGEVGASVPMRDDDKATAREENVDRDAENEVVLENRYLRLIVDPVGGGAAASFRLKSSGKEFVHVYGNVNGRMGLLRDQLWTPAYSFAQRSWSFELENKDDSAAVTLWTTGAGGMMGFTEIRKRIEIRRDAQDVRVSYQLKNQRSSQTEYDYALWCHNFAGVLGEPTRYFFPTPKGVVSFPWPTKTRRDTQDHWYREPARSWAGFVGKSGVGLGVDVENAWLNCFYQWAVSSCLVPTFEWRYNIARLRPGETFKTSFTLTPFTGLDRLDGVFGPVAVALDTPASVSSAKAPRLQFTACASEKTDLTAEWSVRALLKGKPQPLGKTTLTLDLGKPVTRAIPAPRLKAGAYVITGVLTRGGKRVGSVERPFSVDGVTMAYTMAPEGPRKGKTGTGAETALKTRVLSTEIKTPHVKWARPYVGGEPRVLFVMDENGTRDVIELWQRMELDFTYDKLLSIRGDRGYLYAGDTAVRDRAAAIKLLDKNLDKPHDLIVVSGMEWKYHFTPEIRRKLLDKVSKGTGLVLISVFGADKALAGVPGVLEGTRRSQGSYKWRSRADDPLTSALPWDLFPTTYGFIPPKRGQKASGRTLAEMGAGRRSYPLLAVSSLGEGRVAILNYNVFTHAAGYMGYGGLLPMISYRGAYLGPNKQRYNDYRGANPAQPCRYWEYQYALLARVVLWAARRDPPVQVAGVTVSPTDVQWGALDAGKATIRLKRLGKVSGGTLDVTWRDRWSQPVDRRSVKVDLSKATQTVTLPAPRHARNGLHFIEVIARDAWGKSAGWGVGTFRVVAPVRMTGLHFAKGPLPFGKSSMGTVALDGAGRGGERLALSVTDQWGRELTRQELTVPTGAKEVPFTLAVLPPATTGITLSAALRTRDGATLDTARVRKAVLNPPFRDRTRLRFTSWHAIWLWRSHYLFPVAARQVQDLGLDIALNGTVEEATGRVWDNNWYGVRLSPLGMLGWTRNGKYRFPAHGYAEQAKAYGKTHDTKCLVRSPCLHDPAFIRASREEAKRAIEMCKRYGGVRDVCMGDEMSLTHYTRNFDYCFGPHTIDAFRKWLPTVYPSVQALNTSWGTSFKEWPEVMPLTLYEARKRGNNFAPWADHRTFMEVSLARFFSRIREGLAKGVPGLRAGLSGTQAPVACNGMDWWRMSKAFDFYHSYNTGNSRDMRRSFAPETGVAMSPYALGYNQAGRRVESRAWDCLFTQTEGISAWTTRLFFRGDLTFSPSGRDTRDTLRELKSGFWRLIRHSKMESDGIALHYSHPSVHASLALGRDRAFAKARNAWVKLLLDAGLSFDFLAYAQIDAGALNSGKYKVLILPESFALSDTEVREIEKFVRNGGVLLADNSVGLMNDHCTPHARPPLDALFGVRRGKLVAGAVPNGVTLTRAFGGLKAGASVKYTGHNRTLRAAGSAALAKSAGGFPAVFRNAAGRGRTFLLNMTIQPYADDRMFGGPNATRMQDLLLAVVAEAGVKPLFDARNTKGERARFRAVRYRNGDETYLGLVTASKNTSDAEPIRIRLNRRYDVTDVRTRRKLGVTSEIRTAVLPGQARLYCLRAPGSRAPALSLRYAGMTIPPESRPLFRNLPRPGYVWAPAGGVLSWKASFAGPRRNVRVLFVEFLTPDGKSRRPYEAVYVLKPGQREATLSRRFALNDPAGRWKVRVRDIATGKTVESPFTVSAVAK